MPAATRRLRLAVALLAVVALAGLGLHALQARAIPGGGEELEFLARLNDLRGSRGLAPLAWSDALAGPARTWSTSMAQRATLAHDTNYQSQIVAVAPDWLRVGENVGRGGDVATVHNAFVASPGHLANMVGDFQQVGIGVARTSAGLYVTVRFLKAKSGPGPGSNPIGAVDGLAWSGPGQLTVSGWTLDPDTPYPISVLPVVDGVWRPTVRADSTRADVGALTPGYGTNHGFAVPLTGLAPGPHQVCVWGVNVVAGVSVTLGCQSATVPANPLGYLDAATGGPGTVTARGWSFDPDTTAPAAVLATVDGAWMTPLATANLGRPDVGGLYPAYGPNRGYQVTYPAARGTRQVCAWSVNVGPGAAGLLGCAMVTVS